MHARRRVRLLAAAGFLVGFVCLVVGLAVEFTASETTGTSLVGVGALAMSASRLVARKHGLPTP